MKNIVISSPNTLFSSGLSLFLEKDPHFFVIREDRLEQLKTTCLVFSSDVLIAEVRHYPPYTVNNWLQRMDEIRENLPQCKIALLVDENSHPEVAEEVKDAKQQELIDAFFYGTVSGEYMAAVIESM